MNDKEKVYEVDGIFFQKDGKFLVMSYKVDGTMHRFQIQEPNAIKMAETLQEIYLNKN